MMLPPFKPIAMKEWISMLFIERGEIDVLDGAFVVIDKNGVRTHIPVSFVYDIADLFKFELRTGAFKAVFPAPAGMNRQIDFDDIL